MNSAVEERSIFFGEIPNGIVQRARKIPAEMVIGPRRQAVFHRPAARYLSNTACIVRSIHHHERRRELCLAPDLLPGDGKLRLFVETIRRCQGIYMGLADKGTGC